MQRSKEETIGMLNEAISMEEISTFSNLEDVKELVERSELGKDDKEKLLKNISQLVSDTRWHTQSFTEMIKEVLNEQ